MGRGLDQLTGLKDDGIEYLKLRWSLLRLDAVEKLSTAASKAVGRALFAVFALMALGFLLVALALWIGEMLGHTYLGFLFVGGGLLVIAIILLLVGGRLVENSMVRRYSNMFFTEKDDHHVNCG